MVDYKVETLNILCCSCSCVYTRDLRKYKKKFHCENGIEV